MLLAIGDRYEDEIAKDRADAATDERPRREEHRQCSDDAFHGPRHSSTVFAAGPASSRRCGVITARNPVHAALFLVLAFFTSAGDLDAAAGGVPRDRAGAGLRRRGDGAVPVRRDDARHQHGAAARGVLELPAARRAWSRCCSWSRWCWSWAAATPGFADAPAPPRAAGRLQQHQGAGPAALHRVRLSVRDRRGDPAGRDRRGDRAHAAPAQDRPSTSIRRSRSTCAAQDRVRIVSMPSEKAG